MTDQRENFAPCSCWIPPSAEAARGPALLPMGVQCVDFLEDLTTIPCHLKHHRSIAEIKQNKDNFMLLTPFCA